MTNFDTTLSALHMQGYGVFLDANPYGHEDCWMNCPQTTDVTTTFPIKSEIEHNGIGLPSPCPTCIPSTDHFHELCCIFQRSLRTGQEEPADRPHRVTMNLSGVDLIRLVQLAMYPTGERK